MVFLLPYFYAFAGFCFAFLGNTFTKELNQLSITQISLELVHYGKETLGLSSADRLGTMSFHINEVALPGIVYVLAIISFLMACHILYEQIDVENLEESLVKMVVMSLLFFICVFVFIAGGKIMIISSGVFIVMINAICLIYAFLSLFFKTSQVKVNS